MDPEVGTEKSVRSHTCRNRHAWNRIEWKSRLLPLTVETSIWNPVQVDGVHPRFCRKKIMLLFTSHLILSQSCQKKQLYHVIQQQMIDKYMYFWRDPKICLSQMSHQVRTYFDHIIFGRPRSQCNKSRIESRGEQDAMSLGRRIFYLNISILSVERQASSCPALSLMTYQICPDDLFIKLAAATIRVVHFPSTLRSHLSCTAEITRNIVQVTACTDPAIKLRDRTLQRHRGNQVGRVHRSPLPGPILSFGNGFLQSILIDRGLLPFRNFSRLCWMVLVTYQCIRYWY